jgi:beta-mannosidase
VTKQPLDIANWTVRAVGDLSEVPAAIRGQELPARVPGCVHTDLIRAGLVPDPLVGMNEREVQWIGETDWEYRARFEADAALLAHERVDLVCEGLDTIAEVRLNGVEVGRAANMFHPHRFDLRAAIRPGTNELSITFRSPLKHIRAEEERLGKRPVNGDWDPYIFIRKAACNFGWDWAPKLATCGIWKFACIHAWSGVRVSDGHSIVMKVSPLDWEVEAKLKLEWAKPDQPNGVWDIRLSLSGLACDAASATRRIGQGDSSISLRLPAKKPRLWWPRGTAGVDQMELGFLSAELLEGGDPLGGVNDWQASIGFREVRLLTAPDQSGTRFALEVNGKEIFCKGANWIPDGPFPLGPAVDDYDDDPTRAGITKRLKQAAAANINMLRVWGGGYYESDAFYEICDELGIMVWQDFMFACAMYPEEEPYPKLIEAEARHQIARLSSHPSVVLWCGGNECVWAHEAWGNAPGEKPWKERLAGKTWGAGYYFDLLPRLVKELDPTRPYWPNSPWPGPIDAPLADQIENRKPKIENVNSADHGDRHTWDRRADAYRSLVPRFCSEFGHQSPSNHATLARVLAPEDLTLASPALEHRQRATGGTKRHIDEPMAELFREPRDFDEWHYLAQLTQARAIKAGIEWLRVNRPRCMGALIWQLNDCWPGMSWSLIDSDGGEKFAYHAAKEAFRNRLITIQPFDGQPWLCIVNDDDEPARYILDLRRMDFEGSVLAKQEIEAACEASSAANAINLREVLGEPEDPTQEFIVADTIGRRATWFYAPDKALAYPRPHVRLSCKVRRDGAIAIRIEAVPLIRDLHLAIDRILPQGYGPQPSPITLLPGEAIEHIFTRAGGEPGAPVFDPHLLAQAEFLRCANQFGAP